MALPAATTPSLHPNLGEVYRNKVAALHEQLSAGDGDNSAVLEALRDLIERVDFGPGENGEREITLTSALAAMVRFGMDQNDVKTSDPGLFCSSVKASYGGTMPHIPNSDRCPLTAAQTAMQFRGQPKIALDKQSLAQRYGCGVSVSL
jgi:hypothetical protein